MLEMTKVSLSEATDIMLDWAVATAVGLTPQIDETRSPHISVEGWDIGATRPYEGPFRPTTNGMQALYLADRYKLACGVFNPATDGPIAQDNLYWAVSFDRTIETFANNRLRAIVENIISAELGNEFEVPLDLVQS